MANLEDFDGVVADMMADFGGVATYISQSNYSFDPLTGVNSVSTVSIQVQAIIMELSEHSGGISFKYKTLIQEGDKLMYLRPPEKVDSSAVPLHIDPTTDKIIMNNITYKIVAARETDPSAANIVLHEVYVRR